MKNSKDRTGVRQNDTYTASRKHAANLRRNPTLHFQVGLILALLVAIFFMEIKMPSQALKPESVVFDDDDPAWNEIFQVEKVEVKMPDLFTEERKQPVPQIPDEVKEVDDDHTLLETVLEGTSEPEIDTPMIDPNAGVAYVDEEEDYAPVPLAFIEEAPLFPGCEKMNTNDERRECMSSKVSRLIQKKFDTGIGERLGLSGINNIDVMFTVDATGKVTDVKARAPHDKLEEEAKRVIDLLPDMKPGRQGDRNIGVIYSQRISFKIQD